MNMRFGSFLLIFVVGVLLSVGNARAQVSTAILDDRTYDFGLNPIGNEIHHTFILKNTGKKTLTLNKVETNCECTKVASYPKQIAPGAEGQIVAVMDHHHAGYTDVTISAQTGPALSDLYVFRLIGIHVDKPAAIVASPAQITAKDALQLQAGSKDLMIVDIRPADSYAQVHVRDSFNIQPFVLGGEQSYKNQPILLIGEGADDPSLPPLAEHLKTLGFKNVRFLAGGLRAWQMAGGVTDGSASSRSANIALLSPTEFYSDQKGGAGWLVVNVDGSGQIFPTTYPVKQVKWNNSSPADFVKTLTAASSASSVSRILMVSSQGGSYDQIEAALRGSKVTVPIYYLQGGSQAYALYMHSRTLAMSSQTITVKGAQAYMASTRTTGQVIRGAGCGSCGH